MRSLRRGSLAPAMTIMIGLWLASTGKLAAEEPKSQPPVVYLSPTAVFEAWRAARNNGDWRTVFSCLTPEFQEYAVLERYIGTGLTSAQREAESIRRKHGLDGEAMLVEYRKLVAERQRKAEKDREANLKHEQVPSDDELLRKVLCAHIKDKAGFFKDVTNLMRNPAWESPVGNLQNLKIRGDAATGATKEASFRFRKVNGGWLLAGEKATLPERVAPAFSAH